MHSPSYDAINRTIPQNSPVNTKPYHLGIKQNKINQELQFSPFQIQSRLNYHKIHDHSTLIFQPNDQQQISFINSNSIVKRYQLLLICILIMASIASVKFSTEGNFYHMKNVRNYFNSKLLGNAGQSLYQEGDNIDESQLELSDFGDINDHFDSVIEVINNFTGVDGFSQFYDQRQQNVQLSIFYLNSLSSVKKNMKLTQFQDFLWNLQKREFLLNLRQMKFSIDFGSNKKIQNLNLTVIYTVSAFSALQVELFLDYDANYKNQTNANDVTIRIVQQVLAFLLLCSYLHNLYVIRVQNISLKNLPVLYAQIKTFQKNRTYWCYSLIILNLITMMNQTLAPLTSFLQLLPVFQRHNSASNSQYNFNTNLRYAIPLVLRIFIPVIIFLNGFIFYSMLMYPGNYFENYTMGFFSYVYQNFQVGTYQIFTELKDRGNFAYFLYGVLYFYMVLVGNNLFPALFCTMIYIKMYEKDLKQYIDKTVKTAICPHCAHNNFEDGQDNKNIQININSPKISPYLRGKLSTLQQNKTQFNLITKVTKMYVQDQGTKNSDTSEFLKSKVQKFKTLSQKLRKITQRRDITYRQIKIFGKNIGHLIQIVDQSVFLTPIRSPLTRF